MKKKNISAEEQMRRLGNRWVFDCANRLMADEGMERKAAFRQAVRAYHLLELLGKGEAEFEYLKVNGEKRHARGTLCRGISAEFKRQARCGTNGLRNHHLLRPGQEGIPQSAHPQPINFIRYRL